jgi:hypothetical protein
MALTKTQKALAYGLTKYPLSEEDQEAIFLILAEDEAKTKEMIKYLAQNETATDQDILKEMSRILKT